MDDQLKNSFESIKDYKNDIMNVLSYINNKSDILNGMYKDYLSQINDALNYRLSLDAFNFQTKLIQLEYQSYTSIFKIFLNRMYGDYYKLYKKLVDYVQKEVTNVKIVNNNTYPKYKDLETNVEYNFEIIDSLFTEILSIITELSNYSIKENYLIKEIEKKQNNGINISNFLNEKKYAIAILEQKIKFYYDILHGHITFQSKFCKRLYLKLKLIYTQLCNDINLETSISKNDNIITLNKVSSYNSIDNEFEKIIENELDKQLENNEFITVSTFEHPDDKIENIETIEDRLNKKKYIEKQNRISEKKTDLVNIIDNENTVNESENKSELIDKKIFEAFNYKTRDSSNIDNSVNDKISYNKDEDEDEDSDTESIDSGEFMKFF